MVTQSDVTKSEIKGGATGEAFKEQCFLWERGASVGADSDNVFQTHKKLYKALRERRITCLL